MLTTEKHYIVDLTMKECLDEYKALFDKLQEVSLVYISIPKESRQQCEEEFNELHGEKVRFAEEIADRLTNC